MPQKNTFNKVKNQTKIWKFLKKNKKLNNNNNKEISKLINYKKMKIMMNNYYKMKIFNKIVNKVVSLILLMINKHNKKNK